MTCLRCRGERCACHPLDPRPAHPADCPCEHCADSRAALLLDAPPPDPRALRNALYVFAAVAAFFAAFGAVLLTH